MADLKNFINGTIDYVLVVNSEFRIIYNSRYDKDMGSKRPDLSRQQYLFDMYPSLNVSNSSIARTMSTGEVIVNDAQEFADSEGRIFVTQNMTFPLYKNGRISGVVELTKDLTDLEHVKYREKYLNKIAEEDSFIPSRDKDEKITFDDILTLDDEMLKAIDQAKLYATHSNPTLIYGETGTGKELFAQAMINYASMPKQKIVVQNCAAVPDALMESILFGSTRGSFTGAENKKGLFEEADGGIFFLDELNAMPYEVQGKLLRVLQDGTFRPIGSNREKRVNVKIIAAMNVDPIEAMEKKILRNDLFYRLSSSMIYLPPLRDRKDDIEYITDNYIEYYNNIYGKHVEGISESLRKLFLDYSWEGNVRELKHVIESMVSISKDAIIDVDQIPLYLHKKMEGAGSIANVKAGRESGEERSETEDAAGNELIFDFGSGKVELKTAMDAVEKKIIEATLVRVGGNKTKAGEILGIPRQTLKYKMDKLGISDLGE